jgi:hypothetical protein
MPVKELEYRMPTIGRNELTENLASAPALTTNVTNYFPAIKFLDGLGHTSTKNSPINYTIVTHGDYATTNLETLADDAVTIVRAISDQGGELVDTLNRIDKGYVEKGAELIRSKKLTVRNWDPSNRDNLVASLADAGFAYRTQHPIDDRQEVEIGVTSDDLYGKNTIALDPMGLLVDAVVDYYMHIDGREEPYDAENVWAGISAAIDGAIPIRQYSRTSRKLELIDDFVVINANDFDKLWNGDQSVVKERLEPMWMKTISRRR